MSVESWNSVIITDNTIQFMEEGALNAIINPIPPTVTSTTPKGVGEVIEADVLFEFTRNEVQNANRHSLVTRLPPSARLVVAENRFSHHCDCQAKQVNYYLNFQSQTSFIAYIESLACTEIQPWDCERGRQFYTISHARLCIEFNHSLTLNSLVIKA